MKAGETLKSRGVPMKNKTKRKNRIFRVLLATMLILFGVSFRNDGKIGISGVQSVQAATKNVVVRFWNQSGKTSYSKLRIKVSETKQSCYKKRISYLARASTKKRL